MGLYDVLLVRKRQQFRLRGAFSNQFLSDRCRIDRPFSHGHGPSCVTLRVTVYCEGGINPSFHHPSFHHMCIVGFKCERNVWMGSEILYDPG